MDFRSYLRYLNQRFGNPGGEHLSTHETSPDSWLDEIRRLRLSEFRNRGRSVRIRSRVLADEFWLVPDGEEAEKVWGDEAVYLPEEISLLIQFPPRSSPPASSDQEGVGRRDPVVGWEGTEGELTYG